MAKDGQANTFNPNQKCPALETCKHNAEGLVIMREALIEADMIIGMATGLAEQIRGNGDAVLRHEMRVDAKRILDAWKDYKPRAREALKR